MELERERTEKALKDAQLRMQSMTLLSSVRPFVFGARSGLIFLCQKLKECVSQRMTRWLHFRNQIAMRTKVSPSLSTGHHELIFCPTRSATIRLEYVAFYYTMTSMPDEFLHCRPQSSRIYGGVEVQPSNPNTRHQVPGSLCGWRRAKDQGSGHEVAQRRREIVLSNVLVNLALGMCRVPDSVLG